MDKKHFLEVLKKASKHIERVAKTSTGKDALDLYFVIGLLNGLSFYMKNLRIETK